jgi:hypothetical protein
MRLGLDGDTYGDSNSFQHADTNRDRPACPDEHTMCVELPNGSTVSDAISVSVYTHPYEDGDEGSRHCVSGGSRPGLTRNESHISGRRTRWCHQAAGHGEDWRSFLWDDVHLRPRLDVQRGCRTGRGWPE